MKKTIHRNGRSRWSFFHLLVLMLCLGQVVDVLAQPPQKKAESHSYGNSLRKALPRRSIFNSIPSGYDQLGNTYLYYSRKVGHIYVGSVSIGSIDLLGKFGDYYYSSTYGDYGYVVAMQVDNNDASFVDCLTGSNLNGVSFRADVEPQGEMARMYYTVTNTNDYDVNVSLGAYDDVYVGNNIGPAISRKVDSNGNTYGISLEDGSGAQLCVLFGSGLTGVTGVDDYWFGSYNLNTNAFAMSGHYSSGSNYMIEKGSYDCGIGWCWKDRLIKAGETLVFSYLIAIGDVNLEPNTSFEVTPDDPTGWNDLSRPHRLTIDGEYESPAGLDGIIEFAVEDSDEWIAFTDTLKSGDDFTASLVAMFDPSKPIHLIRFRTRDLVGNTTMLQPIEYVDVSFHSVSGVEDMVFTGDSLYQSHLTSDLEKGKWTAAHYMNNVNVGTATFYLEGVFPYTIGRKPYSFHITPTPLLGGIAIVDEDIAFNEEWQYPEWIFTSEAFSELEEGKDYNTYWENNFMPGTATLTIEGVGNYEGTLSTSFTINKAQLTENQYSIYVPDYEINYDGESHGADLDIYSEYVGEATVTYVSQDGSYNSTVQPVEGGDYDVYLQIAEGTGYYGMSNNKVGSFTIYKINAAEWAALQAINERLGEGGNTPWDLSEGIKVVSTLEGLTIDHGHVTAIDLNGKGLTGQFPAEVLALPNLETLDLSNNNLYGDITTLLTTYAEANPDLASHLKYVDVSVNKFTGNIGQFAGFCPELTTLYANNNCLSEVSPMISTQVTNLSIAGQNIPSAIEMSIYDLASSSLRTKLPTIVTYNHQSQSYNNDVSFLLVDVAPDTYDGNSWGLWVSLTGDNVSLNDYSEFIEYKGQSGDVVHAIDNGTYYNMNGCSFDVKLTFDPGDVNFSGDVNVLDLQAMINYIFKEYWDPFNYTAANLWNDQTINVQDVIGMVNTLMDMGLPTYAKGQRLVKRVSDNAEASISCENGKLLINTFTPVASFDIFIDGCTDMKIGESLAAMGMTCVAEKMDGGVHVIGYSMNGAILPIGETVLGTLDGSKLMVSYAMLSDKGAKEIPSVTNQSITGVGHVDAYMTIVANANGIMLRTTNTIENLSWSVYDMGGSLIDEGLMTNVPAGNYTLCNRNNLAGQTWVVKVKANDDKEMTKKIIIK